MLQLFEKSLKIENDRLLLSHVSEDDSGDLGDLFGEPLPQEKALFMIRALDANRQAGKKVNVIPVTTAEYGLSKAARPFNSRLDRSKLQKNGFTPLPTWQDALGRYLRELDA